MKKIYSGLFLMFLVLFSISVNAQNYWKESAVSSVTKVDKVASRAAFPKSFKLFSLNRAAIDQQLFSIVGANPARHSAVISLPNADGQIEEFEIFEASNFEPALQAQFPQIRAFSGQGITDRYATLKLSIAPGGIQGMIFRTDKQNEFIEAYSADHTIYASFRSERAAGQLPWRCSTQDKQMFDGIAAKNPDQSSFTASSAGQLRTMRLAQSCTGEYANFFGASTAGTTADQIIVMTQFNNTLTRCNGVYEKDLALHLNFIANETAIMFFNPATDPYATVTNAGAPPTSWNSALQATLTSIIGEANYDIGHLFGASGGGGNAGCIGCVCVDGQKGSGITSPATGTVNPSTTFPPSGDGFDIDYVVHEIGHQLGATHTFTFSSEGGPISTSSQMEVGSGITIMGYAGITSQDDSSHSIAWYHAVSIDQIQANLATKSCPVTTSITANNATPVVAPLSNWTIPISTPFALTGSATDANAGDALTYSWEQMDASFTLTGNSSVASPTKASGPNFVSFNPTASPIRLLPRLSTILAGLSVTPTLGGDAIANVEALSSIGRTLSFRETVRDNSPYVASGAGIKVGQTAFADMVVTVSAAVGPFLITTQNAAVSYNAGTTQTVTWSVNGTTGAPTNTANVKISWSTDGGLTFPTVLAASTPNDGTETFTVPSTLTTTGRIKVEAIGNIYFDINNASITVTAPPVGFSFTTPAAANVTCAATAATSSTLATVSNGGYTTPILLTASGNPAGTTVTITPTTVTPGNSATVTLSNTGALVPGTYTVTVTGVSGTITQTVPVTFTVQPGAAPNVTNPGNQVVCAPATATFTSGSTTTGATFQWQSAPSSTGTFTNITGATSATYTTPATTAAMNGMVFHVIVTYQCGTATSTDATLTVNTTAVISSATPTAQTVCNGTAATFTVSATGIALTYQWQSAPSATGPWTSVTGGTGATTASYTTAATTPAMNGTYYRAVVTSTCGGAVNSAAALLTVNTIATISAGGQPTAQSACVPNPATFSVTATGTGLTYQWQVAQAATPTTFVDIPGATAASYTTPATTFPMNGNVYRVNILSTCSPTTPVTSSTAVLTVNNPVSVTQNPIARSGCAGDNFTFSVTATSGGTISYQWQVSTNGGTTYTNIAGATSATYTVVAPAINTSGYLYRVVVSGVPCGLVTTPGVALTLSNRPQVVLTAANGSVNPITTNPGNPSGLYTTVSPAGGNYVYSWKRDGVVLPVLSSSITPANGFFDAFGAYQVTVTDVSTGCTSVSNIVTVSDIPSQRDRLFVSPNPTRDIVHLSYYSSTVTAQSRMVNVYSSTGQRVVTKAFAPTGTYGQMSLDLSGLTAGVYMLELRDASGKRIATEQVIKSY